MKILSVNVAKVGQLFVPQSDRMRRIATAIHKQAVAGEVMVGKMGLDGDEQADPTVHGGLNKAVYAYPVEHYPFWQEHRQVVMKQKLPLPYGSCGENLTVEGILERDIWIGDRLQIGNVVLEVTEPRQPCFKFNAKMGFSHASKLMAQSGYSGFYLRVLETGMLQAGDAIMLILGKRTVSLDQVNQQRQRGRQRDLFAD